MESISSLVRNLAGRSFSYCSGNTRPTIVIQNTTVHPAVDRKGREWLVFYQFRENVYEHSNLNHVKLLAVSLEAAVAPVANALRDAPIDQELVSVNIPAILLDFPSTSNDLWPQYVPSESEEDCANISLTLTVHKKKDPFISDVGINATHCARGYHLGSLDYCTHTFEEMRAELDTFCHLLETNHPLRLAVP